MKRMKDQTYDAARSWIRPGASESGTGWTVVWLRVGAAHQAGPPGISHPEWDGEGHDYFKKQRKYVFYRVELDSAAEI